MKNKFLAAFRTGLTLFLLLGLVVLVSCSSVASGKDASTKPDKSVLLNVGTFIVNISLAEEKVIKLTLSVELNDPMVAEKAQKRSVALRDSIITLLSASDYEVLRSPAGKMLLKDNINREINKLLGEDSVANVYITELLIN